ncbi:hypothetical protein [Enhygromyxa salina]|uniref:Uncharacterized protein n=1 Tax=Enhygromyxa salina TaxID=215803 RepID=A0A2S9YPE0_9BACT|nr:hypothetical protein [Enhygromyxa salina]PRQ06957.1 hypothetical protein ENSA7_33810 [Enhygromyxa salina]
MNDSSMRATLDCFADLLPTAVRDADGYARVQRTLGELPQVFMSNGFGIEHELGLLDDARGRNSLSVSIATELPGVGRLNLARVVTKHLRPWFAEPRFAAGFTRACEALVGHRQAPVFPERCYFGFEVDDDERLRIAGVVWSYFMHAARLGEHELGDLFAQLLGPGFDPANPSIVRLAELCGSVRPLEIGHGIRRGRELFKAYPALRFSASAALLDGFEHDAARSLRPAIEQLGRALPQWDCFCPLDVVDGELVRLGFEFNFEEPGARERYLPVLFDSQLVSERLPESARAALVAGLARPRVTRTNARGERCSFEVTHLKLSIDCRGRLAWKAYFAYRALDAYPATIPILTPWTAAMA